METDADRLESIKAMGGTRIDTDAGFFWAIFDNGFIEQPFVVGVESVAPSLTAARSSDVARLELGKDTQLRIGAETYRVMKLEPDGTGMTRVVLKR